MKPDKWAEIKALQRSGRQPAQLGDSAHLDRQRLQLGMHARVAAPGSPAKSRKPMRKARELK